MIRTSLCNLLSRFPNKNVAAAPSNLVGELPSSGANKPSSPKRRRSLVAGCRCVALVLIVFEGARKGCPPPKFPSYTLTPNTLTFAPQVVNPAGVASASQSMILKSTGARDLTISSITASADYAQTNDCPATLAIGATCTIQVTFSPNAIGVIVGFVNIVSNGFGPSDVSLSGTGIAPVTFSPASLDFGTIAPGTTSTPHTVTLTNKQSTALTISSISTSGDYSQTNNCPASVGTGQSCAIQATFTPTVSGVVPGALTVVTDASPGSQPVALTGTGSGSVTPNLSFSPANLTFADQEAGTNSAAQPVTLTNTSGNSSLTINSVSSASPNYPEDDTCTGQVLPPGGTCTINVAFQAIANLAPMSYPGAITVNDSDSTSPNVIGLSGKGVAPVTAFPQSVDFGTILYGEASPTRTVTITNNHSANEDVSVDVLNKYGILNNGCPSTLSPGDQCNLDLVSPNGFGPHTGALVVTASSGGFLSPHIANLSACRTEVLLTPPSFNFGSVPVGTASDPQTLTITNDDGAVPMDLADISVGGENAADFSIASNTCGKTLATGSSCIVKSIFTPQIAGNRTATLNISDSAQCSPQQIVLSGGSAAGPFAITATTTGTATGTVTSDPAGINCGTGGTTCSAAFASGSTVTLAATADGGAPFVGWVGACSGTGSCVLDMASDKQVMAIFGSNPVLHVELLPVDNGTGTITSSPAGINCGSSCSAEFAPETVVELTATPAAGSGFDGWFDGCAGTGPCAVTVLYSETVTAAFAIPTFSVDATAPTPATISAGQSATSTVTVNSRAGFNSVVSFACSVAPSMALPPTCSIDDITPPANGSANGTLTIHTTAPTAALALPSSRRRGISYAVWLLLLGLVGIGIGGGSRRRSLVVLLLCGLLFGGLLLQTACGGGSSSVVQNVGGGNPGTPAGSYTITVTGMSGSVQSATQLTLVVQ